MPPNKLTERESRAVLLLVHYVRFVVGWLGWRKWLRATGLLDYAFGVDGFLCGTSTTRSILQAREYIYELENSWLRENANELLASRHDIGTLYYSDNTDSGQDGRKSNNQAAANLTTDTAADPTTDTGQQRLLVSPIIRAAIRSLLADLLDLHVRRRFANGRVLINVQNRSQLYSFDYTLCTFMDETVDLMLRSLEYCHTETNLYRDLYRAPVDPPHGPTLAPLNGKLLVPFDPDGRDLLLDPYRHAPSDFFANFRRLLFDRVELDERVLALDNPETRSFELLASKEPRVPTSVILAKHFEHSLLRRSQMRSLLRVNYEDVQAKSVLIAGLLNAGRVGSANNTVDTLARAMRVGVVAVYRLVYLYRAPPPLDVASGAGYSGAANYVSSGNGVGGNENSAGGAANYVRSASAGAVGLGYNSGDSNDVRGTNGTNGTNGYNSAINVDNSALNVDAYSAANDVSGATINNSATIKSSATISGFQSREWQNIQRTFRAMGGKRCGWFPLNGFESASALSLATFKLLFEPIDYIAENYNVNRLTLMNVDWYRDYDTLTKDITENGGSARDVETGAGRAAQRGLIMLATSVLYDVDTIFAELRTAGACIATPLRANRGLFLRHDKYEQLGLLLLPAEITPTYDRYLSSNNGGDGGTGGSLAAATSTCSGFGCDNGGDDPTRQRFPAGSHPGRKFRLVVVFPETSAFDYRAATTQLGVTTLATDIVSHFFPKYVTVVNTGDPDVRPADAPTPQNVVAARVRALLAKVLTFDPFQAKSIAPELAQNLASVGQNRRLYRDKYVFCSSKLWQILRQVSPDVKCHAYVRTSPCVYSPFYADRLVSQSTGGLKPLAAVDQYDTWKVYIYQRSSSQRRITTPIAYNTYANCRAFQLARNGVEASSSSTLLIGGGDGELFEQCGVGGDDVARGIDGELVVAGDVFPPVDSSGGGSGSSSNGSKRPRLRRRYVDLFEQADQLIASDADANGAGSIGGGKDSATGGTSVAGNCGQSTCSQLLRRVTARQSNLICVRDKVSNNWCVYYFDQRANFERQVFAIEAASGVNLVREAPLVYLLGWYIDNYNFANEFAPVVAKVSSKRVYTVNGYLAFCETMTKVVSVEPERIAVNKELRATYRNFANYNVDLRDEVCFTREIARPERIIQLPADHFYNRVYRPMYEQNINGPFTECTMRQPSPLYFVVRLFDVVLWFPTVQLLTAAKNSPTGAICYGDAPSHIVPQLAHYVAQAIRGPANRAR